MANNPNKNEMETPQTNSPASNPLGAFSFGISIAALLVMFFTIYALTQLEQGKSPDKQYAPDDLSVVFDKAGNGLSFLGQVLVFGAGGLVGGTLSLVGFIAGLCSVSRPRNWTSISGIAISIAAPVLLCRFLDANWII